jgi:RNA polymerase sigma factor (sigma-70 family)
MNKDNKPGTITAETISDSEIVTRMLNGEKDLYTLLVRRYNQRLFRIGMSIMNDDAEIEDVMQVTYIKAYENLGKFEFRSGFSTWLIRIFINESLLRLKQRQKSVAMSDGMIDKETFDKSAGELQTPLMKVLNTELKLALEEAIRQLPEKYRTVFVMREIENMNVAETQECLNLSEVNVKVRLNRAKAMLRNTLSNFYNKEEIFQFHLSRCERVTHHVMKKIEQPVIP